MKRFLGCIVLFFSLNSFFYAGIEDEIMDAIPEDSETVAKEVVLAEASAAQIWNTYREKVFEKDETFDIFLDIVYRQGYKPYACRKNPLICFKLFLTKTFLEEAQKRYCLSSTEVSQKERIAKMSFLVCFAANCYVSSILEKLAKDYPYLHEFVLKSLQESYLLNPSKDEFAYKQKWEKLRCKIDYRIAMQLCRYWKYIKEHMDLMADEYWNFLRENRIVKGWPK